MATKKASVETTKEKTVATPIKSEPKKFAPDDMITCRSVTYGELLGEGRKTKMLYTWSGYGDEVEVEYQDLLSWKSTKSQYLFAPHFVIENDELLEQWKDVKAVHDRVKQIDCDKFFELPSDKFRTVLENLPDGYKLTVRNMANAKITNGELDSIAKVKIIDEIFGTDLKSLIS